MLCTLISSAILQWSGARRNATSAVRYCSGQEPDEMLHQQCDIAVFKG